MHENLIQLQTFEKKELNKEDKISITNLYEDINEYEKKLLLAFVRWLADSLYHAGIW